MLSIIVTEMVLVVVVDLDLVLNGQVHLVETNRVVRKLVQSQTAGRPSVETRFTGVEQGAISALRIAQVTRAGTMLCA